MRIVDGNTNNGVSCDDNRVRILIPETVSEANRFKYAQHIPEEAKRGSLAAELVSGGYKESHALPVYTFDKDTPDETIMGQMEYILVVTGGGSKPFYSPSLNIEWVAPSRPSVQLESWH